MLMWLYTDGIFQLNFSIVLILRLFWRNDIYFMLLKLDLSISHFI